MKSRTCSSEEGEKNAYRILVGNPAFNAAIWKTKRTENIKQDLRHICCECRRWMELAQVYVHWQALILAMLNLQVLLKKVNQYHRDLVPKECLFEEYTISNVEPSGSTEES
jgi:hypothetical protein